MIRTDFKCGDDCILKLAIWEEVQSPKAVLQILHGMAEHIERYDDFAKFLNQNGYIVVGSDHRAHGKTCGEAAKVGKVTTKDNFADTVEDNLRLTQWIMEKYSLPVAVMGHSYGSFLLQSYMERAPHDIAAYIVMGSAFMKGATLSLGKTLLKMMSPKKDDLAGQMFANMTFVTYDKKVKEGLNGWLSRDSEQVKKYNEDEYCGAVFSRGFYRSFFNGISNLYKKVNYQNIDKEVPILIISGGDDYVGGNGKLVKKLFDWHKTLGLKSELKLFEGARHEILNETNNREVYEFLLSFLQKNL